MNLPDRFVIECTIEVNGEQIAVRREFRQYRTGYRDNDSEFYRAEELTPHLETGHWRFV